MADRSVAPPPPIIRGAERHPLRDAYHAFLTMRWAWSVGLIALAYLAVNVAFAGVYLLVGGVEHAHPGSFADMFFFSVQTIATVGYGAMYPTSLAANLVVVIQSVCSLVMTALATGLVFAKFSRPTGRMLFSRTLSLALLDGVPTLMFRVGNERGNYIVEATVRLALSRTEITAEGQRFYRMYDLVLSRDRIPALSRTWTVMHPVVEGSPLFGATPETLAACEAELFVSVTGTDDTSMQPAHGRRQYDHVDIGWGQRLADIVEERPSGQIVVDLTRFHELVPCRSTAAFPYPR